MTYGILAKGRAAEVRPPAKAILTATWEQTYRSPSAFCVPNRQPKWRITDDVPSIERGETTPDRHFLHLNLRHILGFLAHRGREVLAFRAAHRRPHRNTHNPELGWAEGARLADDPLARQVVLVRGGLRSSACGLPGHRRAERRGRCERPVAGLQLRDHLPNAVRGAPGQPGGRAFGRASGLERGSPARFAGRALSATRHHDPRTACSTLTLASVLPGGGRLTTLHLGERSRDYDGGDVPVRMALQSHARQRANAGS